MSKHASAEEKLRLIVIVNKKVTLMRIKYGEHLKKPR